MPLVLLRYRPEQLTDANADQLAKELTRIVANALSIPSDPLTKVGPEDIEVSPIRLGERDLNAKDLEIIIFAHSYHSRLTVIDEINLEIAHSVRQFLPSCNPNVRGFVWTHLNQSGLARI